jgi:hypothetical protein
MVKVRAPASLAGRRPLAFGTIWIVGGGCYGSYYARQLGRALAARAISWERLAAIDRDPGCRLARATAAGSAGFPPMEVIKADWSEFFDAELSAAAERLPYSEAAIGSDPSVDGEAVRGVGDAIVPSPLMPHLLFEWLERRARRRWPEASVSRRPVSAAIGVPWERLAPDGTRYVSYADWTCPINCIEPARCPHTRGERSWSLPQTLHRREEGRRDSSSTHSSVVTFHCTHRVYGVGMIDVADVLGADRLIQAAGIGELDLLVGTTSHCHGALSRLVVSRG